MSIRPIDFNGMIQRTDDVGHIKNQQDQKPVTEQQFIQQQVRLSEDQQVHRVGQSNESDQAQNEADAREEGKNKYFRTGSSDHNGKKKKVILPAQEDARVIRKKPGGDFDLKI